MAALPDERGYVKLWRKITDNPFLMHDNNAFLVFVKLMVLVDRRTGSYSTGRFALAAYMNMNPSTLYKVLLRLEDNRLVSLASNNKYTVISISNWGKYQELLIFGFCQIRRRLDSCILPHKRRSVQNPNLLGLIAAAFCCLSV